MKRVLIVLSLFVFASSTIFAATSNTDQCTRLGKKVGKKAARSFCKLLEKAYARDEIVVPYEYVTPQSCDVDATLACKDAMAETASEEFDLCAQLVREDWTDSSGTSAYESWVNYQQSHCYFTSPNRTIMP